MSAIHLGIARQSTQVIVPVGMFRSHLDGVTARTTVALASADAAELLKPAGAATVDISGATWTAITGANGQYHLTLTTSHTDTVGLNKLFFADADLFLPVECTFQVVEENVFDKYYAASGDAGTAIAAILTDTEGSGAIGTILTDTELLLVDTEAAATSLSTIITDTEAILLDTEGFVSGSGLTPLASGTAQAGTASTIQLAAAHTFADDELNGNVVKILTGTGAGQARLITDYVGSTDTATVTPNWITNPASDSTYEVIEGSVNLAAVTLTAQTAGDIIADTEAVLVDSEAILTDSEAILADTEALGLGSGLTALATGTAQGGTGSTIQLASASTFGDDILNGTSIKLTGGTGAGQARTIVDYVGSTDTATITPAWTTQPDATTTYEIVDGSFNLAAVSLTAQTAGDIIGDTEAVLSDSEAALTDSEAILADAEAVLEDTGSSGVVIASLNAAAIDSIIDEVIESDLTLRQILRIMFASMAGKLSGAGSTTVTIQDVAQTKARITATVDSQGNRSAITLDGT